MLAGKIASFVMGASESNIVLPKLGELEIDLIWAVLCTAFIALFYGLYLVIKVQKESPGSAKMVAVAKAIEEGAMAYLKKQVKVMSIFVLIIAVGIWLGLYVYLFRLDARLKKLEHDVHHES